MRQKRQTTKLTRRAVLAISQRSDLVGRLIASAVEHEVWGTPRCDAEARLLREAADTLQRVEIRHVGGRTR